jgi:hypothetical protein
MRMKIIHFSGSLVLFVHLQVTMQYNNEQLNPSLFFDILNILIMSEYV